jgi:flagellar biosynthesis protein FliR
MRDIVDSLAALLPNNISPYDALLFFMLIMTRWIMMTMTMPFLGGQLLPSLVRIGLAALLSAVCFVMLIDTQNFIELNIALVILLFVKEAALGFFLGFFASLIFYTYELLGELLDISRAASMSRLLVPELKHQSSPMGVLLFQLSLVTFIGFGFHRDVIHGAYESFLSFPVMSLESGIMRTDFLAHCITILAVLFKNAFRFALPIVIVSFLIDLAFGLMNRVAPQINAYFLSLPAKMLGGLIIVFFVLPFLLDDFSDHYRDLSRYFHFYVSTQ